VFSVVDRLLFRSLPYAEDLVSVGLRHPIIPDGEFLLANTYLHMREEQTPFAALASWTGMADCDLTGENPARLACAQVDSAFLDTFGVVPEAGRTFTPDEDAPNARKVALISHGLWASRFGGDRSLLGKTVPIDGVLTEIIGVLPVDFELPTLQKVDLAVPQALAIRRYTPNETGRPLRVFGRLKKGVSIAEAKSAMEPEAEDILKLVPPAMRKQASFVLRPVRDLQIQNVKLASWILFATTLAILLIVCANVGNLVLARSEARRREFAVRMALGAGRWRLTRQTLAESLLLSSLGAAFGVLLAWTLVRLFRAWAPVGLPRIEQASVDSRVLVFLVAMTLFCGVAVGLLPVFGGIRLEMLAGWRSGGPARTGHLLRRVLVTAQIALSLTLLSDASLLLDSLRRMTSVDGGLGRAESVMTAEIVLPNARHPNAQSRQQFFDTVAERLRANPMVTAAAISDTVPPSGFIHNKPMSGLRVVGRPDEEQLTGGTVSWRSISPDYFEAMGVRIQRGRGFMESERTSKTSSIVVSFTLGKALFGQTNPVGHVIHFMPNGPDAEIIGVAADADNSGTPGNSDPEYYVLRKVVEDPAAGTDVGMVTRALHNYDGQAFVIVRSAASPAAVAGWIRAEVAALDPTVAMTIATVGDRVRAVSARPRFNATLLSLFALIGLVVAAIGLYGLITFLVVQRTREFGVRMALGATAGRIGRIVLGGALRSSGAGVLLGLVGAISSARLLRSILFGAVDQVQLVLLSAFVLVAIGVLASLAPALRASRVDPAEALRQD